jgi:hypothetical protein
MRVCDTPQRSMMMYSFRSKQNAQAQTGYATCSDLCDNFVDDLEPLYVLAFLLTGSHAEAEQCFVATLDDAVTANGVFKGWERPWNKRCLILNAIRRVFSGATASSIGKGDARCGLDGESRGRYTINAVSTMAPPFQRFVFVMSVLERYSEHECALLLRRPPRDVFEARICALWQLSGVTPALAKVAG